VEFGLLISDGKETKFKQKYYSVLVNIPSQMRSKVSGTRKQFHFYNKIKVQTISNFKNLVSRTDKCSVLSGCSGWFELAL